MDNVKYSEGGKKSRLLQNSKQETPNRMFSESPSKPEEGCGGASSLPQHGARPPGCSHLPIHRLPSASSESSGYSTLLAIHTGFRGTWAKQQGRGTGGGRGQLTEGLVEAREVRHQSTNLRGSFSCLDQVSAPDVAHLPNARAFTNRGMASQLSLHQSFIITLRSDV